MAQLVKESACNVGDLGSIPGLGRCPGEGNGYPLQYPGLETSMDCIVQFSSVAQLCPTLCNLMGCRMPGFPVHHQLLELAQIHVHWVSDAIQPSHWAPTDLGSSSFRVLSFVFSYCPWGSQGKNTEVVCHSLLQWTTCCQNFPPWPVHLGWPHTAWLMVSLS